MIDHLRNLMGHAEWANAVFFHTWGKSPARDNEEMRRRAEHVVGVQTGFLSVLRGEPPGGPSDAPPGSYDDLKAWFQSNHKGLRAYAGSLDEATLVRKVKIPWFPDDPPCVINVAEALVQAAMHTQHHRGQLMTRLRDLGGEPKNVDWIIWLWKGKPQPRWS